MADKDQVEENGKGGDVVDGNSQGGKKGKKGERGNDPIIPIYDDIAGKGGKKKEGGVEAGQQQLSPDQQEKLRQAMEMLSMQNQVKQISQLWEIILFKNMNILAGCSQK